MKAKFSDLIPSTVSEKEEMCSFLDCYDLQRSDRQHVFKACFFSFTNRLKVAEP